MNRIIYFIIFISLILFASVNSFDKENRFKKINNLNTITLGLYGEIKNIELSLACKEERHNRIYKNGVRAIKKCANYSKYKCIVRHYCQEEKECEKEAALYWLNNELSEKEKFLIKNNLTYCDKQQHNCDASDRNDYSCLNVKE